MFGGGVGGRGGGRGGGERVVVFVCNLSSDFPVLPSGI